MGETASRLMQTLHGSDIYAGFPPMLPLDLQGWNSHHAIFRDAIAQLRPSTVIDAGVWKGASTIFLADLLREAGIDGGVIAIDTFLGGAERSEYYLRQHGRPLLYEQFLSNVLHSNATDRIVPVPQTTYFASIILKSLGIRAGMIHIDASHEYEDVLRDCRLYWDLLEPGGWLIGDDYVEMWPGVVRAADEFATEINQQLTLVSPKFVLRKSG